MKYLYALLLFVIVIPFKLQAQRNFKPGYIVSISGDTVNGFVDHKDWNTNPKRIAFKTNTNETVNQYSVADIKAFAINGLDHYERYSGAISMGMINLANLSTGIDSSFVIDIVFLRLLIKGEKLNLFSLTDSKKVAFIFQSKTQNRWS